MAEASQEEALRVRLWGRLSAFGLVFAIAAFAIDQVFKWWMLHVFDIGTRQPIALLPVFDVVLAWNRGISYGWLSEGT
jgi:signal peptidase II